MKHLKWGIISTGNIAKVFADTVEAMNKLGENIEIRGVASRNPETAKQFALRHNIAVAYGSYEELAADNDIDIIYIATPNNLHYENMMMCLRHGKHVLCEKPFTVTAEEAREVYAFAKEKNLFVMEAFWTKFIPLYREVEKIIAEGTIGDIRLVTAQYGYCTSDDKVKRKFAPELAGGALLDIGVYNIGFAAMVLGYYPRSILSSVSLNDMGTDDYSAIIMKYEDGKVAQLTTAIQTEIPVLGCIYGSLGHIRIKDYKNPQSIEIIINGGQTRRVEQSFDVNGYEYQIREAESCVNGGRICSDILTPEQSVAVMEIMDSVRDSWQMKFPFEPLA